MACRGEQLPIYLVLGMSVSFALVFALVDVLNFCMRTTLPLVENLTQVLQGRARQHRALRASRRRHAQVYVIMGSALLAGAAIGIVFAAEDVGAHLQDVDTLRVRALRCCASAMRSRRCASWPPQKQLEAAERVSTPFVCLFSAIGCVPLRAMAPPAAMRLTRGPCAAPRRTSGFVRGSCRLATALTPCPMTTTFSPLAAAAPEVASAESVKSAGRGVTCTIRVQHARTHRTHAALLDMHSRCGARSAIN